MKKQHANSITLDIAHSEMLNKFNNNKNILIPKYKTEIEKLEKSLNKKKNSKKKNIESENLSYEIYEIESKINVYKDKISKEEKEEKDYYLNNSKYIFDYFEKKQNINNSYEKINNENKLNSFFSINTDENDNNNDNDNKLDIKYNDKDVNIDKYFYNIDNLTINYDNYCYNSDICKFCRKGELVYVESEGMCICNACSKTVKYLIENEKPSYKEPPKEVCFYAYKRINHLREILAQFQAKETTNIPQEVYENIKNQIKKERISIKELTNKKTKEILKNLGYNKYYEHIPYIKDKLGIKPPIMSQQLEETLCNLFMEIQKPYSKFCPKDRVNFLNYYYTLYKLCEILNEKKFLPFFPMLKDRDKRVEQDQIWKKICDELGWTFIPTP